MLQNSANQPEDMVIKGVGQKRFFLKHKCKTEKVYNELD